MHCCWHCRTAVISFVLVSCASFSQQFRQIPGQKAQSGVGAVQRKNATERHFLSRSPQASWFRDKTLAGSRLLEQRSVRARQLSSRIRTAARFSAFSPAGSPTIYPGIQFRNALPSGIIPTATVSGDFNRDGHADFVVANGYTSDLWIYLGNGDGTFQLPRVIPLSQGLSPVYLAKADLRGNGTLDLIVAEFDTSTIGVLLGNGDGTFGFEQTYTLPQPPSAIVVDDFNRDDKLDVVAVMFTLNSDTQGVDYIATLFGDGTGHFATPVITKNWGFYSSAWNIASGDVNNDGLPDILITGPGLENSTIYLNAANGTFTQGNIVAVNGPRGVNALTDGKLGDFNEDGCLDAAVADLNSEVWISVGDCSGNFTPAPYVQMGDSNAAIQLADADGDGHLDLVTSAIPALNPVVGDVAGNTLSVAFGNGHGDFSQGRDFVGTGQAYSLAIADFNGDGKLDVVVPGNDTDTATLFINNGNADYGFPEGLCVALPGVGVLNAPVSPPYFSDLNGDGKPDVLLLDQGYNGEYFSAVMLNDGTGRFSSPIVTDTAINIINNWLGDFKLGDFRNTGHLDLVGVGLNGAYSGSGSFIFFMPSNGNGTFGPSTVTAVSGADGEMAMGDFNRDGKLDFVAVSSGGLGSNKQLTTFLGNGNGSFRSGGSLGFGDSAEDLNRIFAGDFNRDGKLDVLVYDSGNGYWTTASYVWEFLGNGDGTFQAGRELFSSFQPMTIADINGDHWPDIVRYDFFWPDGTTQNVGPAKFTNYLGQPDGTFAQSSSYAPFAGVPRELLPYLQTGDPTEGSWVSDLNGDGKPDEIAFQDPSSIGSTVYAQILMGLGDGTFIPTYDYFAFFKQYGYPKYSHDLDGNGSADLLELDGASSSMHVFKPAPAPSLQLVLEDEQLQTNNSCGWVFPNIPATSDRSITLFSSVPGVVLPASVTIPAGALSQQFCYSVDSKYDWHRVFDVRAQLGSDVAVAYASRAYTLGFTEVLSPTDQQVFYPGQSTTPITVTLNSSQGYGSTVHLSCQNLPLGSSCQFGSDTLILPPSGIAGTTLVVNTNSSAHYGGNIDVVADDGQVTKRQPFTYVVQPLMVNLSGGLRGAPGTKVQATLMVNGLPPYLPSCLGLPAGLTCSFVGDALPWPSSSTYVISVPIPVATPGGSYPFTISVNSGPITTNLNATLDVNDFAFGLPSVTWMPPGGSVTTALSLQSIDNFHQYVTVSCSLNIGGTCTGNDALPGVVPAQLAVSVPQGTPLGTYALSVTGVSGVLSHTVTFPFTIADYSGSLSGSLLNLTRDAQGTLTATISATDGFAGRVSFACTGSGQITCSFNPSTVQPTAASPAAATVTFTAGPGAGSRSQRLSGTTVGLMSIPLAVVLAFRRRKWHSGAAFTAFISITLCTLSCGGSGSAGQSGGGGSGGGGSNTYSITVTAAANQTNSSRKLGVVEVTVTH